MGREDESLRVVIASWPSLPPHIIQAILALVHTAGGCRTLCFVVTMSDKRAILDFWKMTRRQCRAGTIEADRQA